MALVNIPYTPLGYPVYKSFIIPYRDGDGVVTCRRLEKSDVDNWRETLAQLREFLELVEGTAADEEVKVELIADMVAAFFKAPLIADPLPSLFISPSKLYVMLRSFGSKRLSDLIMLDKRQESFLDVFRTVMNEDIIRKIKSSKLYGYLSSRRLYEVLENSWFVIPADTRPGYNVSSLVPHLLLSSAAAWCIAVNNGGVEREEAALIRIAAMFHDAGKPFNYQRHVEPSLQVARSVLGNVIHPSYIDKIVEIIERHHEETSPLHKADRAVASIDRLNYLVSALIGNEIRDAAKEIGEVDEVKDELYQTGWSFWRRLYEHYSSSGADKVRELSEKFVNRLAEHSDSYKSVIDKEKADGEEVKDIDVLLIDIGGIQNFIYKGEDLRSLSAASLSVDFLTMAYIPLFLQSFLLSRYGIWPPYEAFVYSAGGVVEVLLPSRIAEKVSGELEEELNRRVKGRSSMNELSVRLIRGRLYTKYSTTTVKLSQGMAIKKNTSRMDVTQEVEGELGKEVKRLCENCRSRRPARGERVCEVCRALREIGSAIHFKEKYTTEVELPQGISRDRILTCEKAFGIDWNSASNFLTELIAGNDPRKLPEEKIRSLAVVACDGNLMGPFIASSVSLTDKLERSTRIDIAMKKALRRAVEEISKAIGSEDGEEAVRTYLRVYLGTVYAGGDDALILSPAWASPILATRLSEEFARELGGARGLSVGLVAVNARANIWGAIDAAKSLLKFAKDKGRDRLGEGLGYIAFDAIDAGMFSGSTSKSRLGQLEAAILSHQPYVIGRDSDNSINALLSIILSGSWSSGDPKGAEDAVRKAFKIYIGGEEQNEVKRLRNVIRRALSSCLEMAAALGISKDSESYVGGLIPTYIARQIARVKEGTGGRAYEITFKLIPGFVGSNYSALGDAFIMIKILGGGLL
ncbi:MAG: HD domain-containing protein [Aigarchaeota archaeon]|nr:HD domain-containing protein [Candidatus Pelearchaeum maunauluense]